MLNDGSQLANASSQLMGAKRQKLAEAKQCLHQTFDSDLSIPQDGSCGVFVS